VSAHLQVDDKQALRRALTEVRGDVTAFAAEAEVWAAQGSKGGRATIELLQRGLALRRALARLSRRLVLTCGERLSEEGVRGDPGTLRSLVQLLLLMDRLSCLRCRVAASIAPEQGHADRPRAPYTAEGVTD
jgi:hypothetical protein